MATDEERLLKETLDLAEMLASAESIAGKALDQVATLRQHHRARLAEWQKARGLTESSPDPDLAADRVPPSLIDSDGDGNTAADAAAERHDVVASALKRAEANRDTRIDAGERPGRGTRLSTDSIPGETIETREDGAERPPADEGRLESDGATDD